MSKESKKLASKAKKDLMQTLVTQRFETSGAVVAWTDGACEPNPDGDGGWGVRLEWDSDKINEFANGEAMTTNNRMELTAIIESVKRSPVDRDLIIRTDSQLCIFCAVGYWKRKANLDLWAALDTAMQTHKPGLVKFEWWRGHIGTAGNERADELASIGRLWSMEGNEEECPEKWING